MKYTDLNINQRISLKGIFKTDKRADGYGLVMEVFNFKVAVEYFLNNDINILRMELAKTLNKGF